MRLCRILVKKGSPYLIFEFLSAITYLTKFTSPFLACSNSFKIGILHFSQFLQFSKNFDFIKFCIFPKFRFFSNFAFLPNFHLL